MFLGFKERRKFLNRMAEALRGAALLLAGLLVISMKVQAQEIPPAPPEIPAPAPPRLPDLSFTLPATPEVRGALELSTQVLMLKRYAVSKAIKPDQLAQLRRSEIKKIGSCSGFLMKEGSSVFLVTARHCLKEPRSSEEKLMISVTEKTVMRPDLLAIGEFGGYDIKILAEEFQVPAHRDIAVVAVDPNDFPHTEILERAKSRLPVGDFYRLLGYPQGLGPFEYPCMGIGFRMGLMNSSKATITPTMNCPTSTDLEPIQGASGGPVVNQDNQVVGVLASVEGEPFEVEMKETGNILKGFAFNGLTHFTDITELQVDSSGISLPQLPDGEAQFPYLHPGKKEFMTVNVTLEGQVLVGEFEITNMNGEVNTRVVLEDGVIVYRDGKNVPASYMEDIFLR